MSYHSTIGATAQFYWTFNDNTASTNVAAAVGGVAGTASANTSTMTSVETAAGVVDSSFSFNGSSRYITFGDNNEFSPVFDSAFSVSMWVRPHTNTVGTIAGKNNEWMIAYGEGGGVNKFHCMIRGTAGEYVKYVTETGTSALDTWFHIGVSWDGANLKLYKNGTDVTSLDINNSTASMGNTANAMEVGRQPSGIQYFNGNVQAFGVWDSVLTGTDFTNHYIAGSSAPTNVTVNADVTNVAIAGQAVAAHLTQITATAANISIAGQDADVQSATGSRTITAAVTNVTIIGQATTVTAETSCNISAAVSNVAVTGRNATFITSIQDYDTKVTADAPKHWWKFTNDFADSGSAGNYPFAVNLQSGDSYQTTGAITGTSSDVYLLRNSSGFYFGDRYPLGTTRNDFLPNSTTGGSIECWVKTSSTSTGVILAELEAQIAGQAQDIGTYTVSHVVAGGVATWTRTYTEKPGMWMLGTVNGYLAQGITNGNSVTTCYNRFNVATGALIQPIDDATPHVLASQVSWTPTSKYIADGNWHHIVLTATVSGGSTTYRTYVDNVEVPENVCPAVTGTNWITQFGSSDWMGIFRGSEGGLFKRISPALVCHIDEVAIYSTGLSPTSISNHYMAAYGSTTLDPNPTVEAEVANISINGQAASISLGRSVIATTANINIDGKGAVVSGLGSRTIGSDITNVSVAGQAATVTTTKTIVIALESNPGNIALSSGLTGVLATVDDLTFNFITSDTIKLSANDTTGLSSIAMGAFLYAQHKDRAFKIANTSLFAVSYVVSAVSDNPGIPAAVGFSLDNQNFYSSVVIDPVEPNGISSTIYMKMYIASSLSTGDGNFLINVEPTNVGS